MLKLDYKKNSILLERLRHCVSTIAGSLVIALALYVYKKILFDSELQLYTAFVAVTLGCLVLCSLFLRSISYARFLIIDDSDNMRLEGLNIFTRVEEIDSRNIWRVREIKRFGRRYLRLDLLNRAPLVFVPEFFDERSSFDLLVERMLGLPLATKPKISFPYAGLVLGTILIIAYLNSPEVTTSTSIFDLISAGAWNFRLLLDGELYRSLSYGFIHGSWMHLAQNVASIILLSFAMEHVLGRLGLVALFGIGVILSGIGGFFMSAMLLVGASGGVYAIAGAYMWSRFFHPDNYIERFGTLKNSGLVIVLCIDTIFGALIDSIGLGVHVIGFATGVTYGYLFLNPRKLRQSDFGTGVVVVLLVAVALVSVWQVHNWKERDSYDLAVRWLEDPTSSNLEVNASAWHIVVGKVSNPPDQYIAIKRMENFSLPEERDTLASLLARTGDFNQAISIEQELVNNHYKKIYVSQLARFQLGSIKKGLPIDSALLDGEASAIADIICVEDGKQVFKRRQIDSREAIASICQGGDGQLVGVYPIGSEQRKIRRVILDPEIMALPANPD